MARIVNNNYDRDLKVAANYCGSKESKVSALRFNRDTHKKLMGKMNSAFTTIYLEGYKQERRVEIY
jgi:hypothetical protein